MKNLKFFAFFAIMSTSLILGLGACGGDSAGSKSGPKPVTVTKPKLSTNPSGVGEIKNVKLNDPLMASMVSNGKGTYEVKCAACHKLTDQRVVGPGWTGVTSRRTPEWIMNMTLNVDVMLEEDEAARKLLAECLVRMPNQSLTKDEARDVLEFMYANDGKTVGK